LFSNVNNLASGSAELERSLRPQWVKLRKVSKEEIYRSAPYDRYYKQRLGSR